MKYFKLNPVKKKAIYHYSKFAPYGKLLKIKLDNGIKFFFRARTGDRTAIKEVWARNIYDKPNYEIKEKDIVFDLGGHIGTFSVYAASKAIKGKVFAFEAMKDNYDVLLFNIKLNSLTNVIAENVAVSKEKGRRTFYLSSPDAGKKIGYGTGGHSFFPSKNRDEKIEVETNTLEALMKKYNVEYINYLKLDTEGAEFDILFSSSNSTLQKIEKIVMELHPFGENTKDKMLKFLQDRGFKNSVENYGETEYMVYSKR